MLFVFESSMTRLLSSSSDSSVMVATVVGAGGVVVVVGDCSWCCWKCCLFSWMKSVGKLMVGHPLWFNSVFINCVCFSRSPWEAWMEYLMII